MTRSHKVVQKRDVRWGALGHDAERAPRHVEGGIRSPRRAARHGARTRTQGGLGATPIERIDVARAGGTYNFTRDGFLGTPEIRVVFWGWLP